MHGMIRGSKIIKEMSYMKYFGTYNLKHQSQFENNMCTWKMTKFDSIGFSLPKDIKSQHLSSGAVVEVL